MREISAIVVHGTWTRPALDVGAEEIRGWHKEGNGWSDIGYHRVIRRNGKTEKGRPIEKPGAHVKGHNEDTIGVVLVGGRDDMKLPGISLPEEVRQEVLWEFNYTDDQIFALIDLVAEFKSVYGAKEVLGHRDYRGVAKRCPGFDVRAFFSKEA